MALIEQATKRRKEGKNRSSGSYERVFNNKELGELISDVHSTSISNGTELEKKIIDKFKNVVNDPETFHELLDRKYSGSENLFLIPKKIIKKSNWAKSNEPDFVIIDRKNETIIIIELKDGWVFDTKKSRAELENLKSFQDLISKNVSYKTKFYVCSFNNNDSQEIYQGFKRNVPFENIMTGQEFCELLEIDYDEINNERAVDGVKNTAYFIENILKIAEVRDWIKVNISDLDD